MKFLQKMTREIGTETLELSTRDAFDHLLQPGTAFTYLGHHFYSLGVNQERVLFYILKDNPSLEVLQKPFDEVYRLIKEQSIELVFEEPVVIDDTLLSDKEVEQLTKLKEAAQTIVRTYGPDYQYLKSKKTKDDLRALTETLDLHYKTFLKKFYRYLAGGMKDHKLLAKNSKVFNGSRKRGACQWKNKPGRKPKDGVEQGVLLTDEIREIFDIYVDKHMKSKGPLTETYDEMILREFTTTGLFDKELSPEEKLRTRPTLSQFRHHLNITTTEQERMIRKHGRREFFNNQRPLVGDINYNVSFPGDVVQVDAVESDNSLIARNSAGQVIGRATVYMMRDVYTRLIVAYSIGFEVNSVIGLTNLLMNLCDDKEQLFQEKGFDIARKKIPLPDGFIPNVIVTDRGSDFTSHAFQEVTARLGIEHQFASTGSGSSKGLIERTFRQMNEAHRKALENQGLITKDYDSNHHKTATLTLDEFEKMVVAFIVAENYKPLASLPAHLHSLVNENLPKTPINIWRYVTEIKGLQPRRILDRNQFYFDLMTKIKVKLDRQGLQYEGLRYSTNNDPDFEAMMLKKKTTYIEARMDTRDVSRIYYQKDGKWIVSELSPKTAQRESFWGWSLPEYLDLKKRKSSQEKLESVEAKEIRIGSGLIYEGVVQDAKIRRKEEGIKKNNMKDMREHRKFEKLERRGESTLHRRIYEDETPALSSSSLSDLSPTSLPDLHDDRSYEEIIESIESGY